jgi:hypothetical protein
LLSLVPQPTHRCLTEVNKHAISTSSMLLCRYQQETIRHKWGKALVSLRSSSMYYALKAP